MRKQKDGSMMSSYAPDLPLTVEEQEWLAKRGCIIFRRDGSKVIWIQQVTQKADDFPVNESHGSYER
jgi:hypothetical protein